MSKVSKIFYRFNALNAIYVEDAKEGACGFMQHCIQSTVTHLLMSKVSNTMYCALYTGPLTPPKGKAICYLKNLLSCGFSSSPPVSLRRQLC